MNNLRLQVFYKTTFLTAALGGKHHFITFLTYSQTLLIGIHQYFVVVILVHVKK